MDSLLFLLKKIASRLVFPVGAICMLWLLGAWFWFRRPERRTGPRLLLAAGFFLLILSIPMVSGLLLLHLEDQAGAYADPDRLARQGVRYVVVLSGGQIPENGTPADRLSANTLKRLLEGIRLYKGIPGGKLLVSGGSFIHDRGSGNYMASAARALGVPAGDILTESLSWDTEAQAQRLKTSLGSRPFALVTSASHMPRSMMIFRRYGMNPIPAPTDFKSRNLLKPSYQTIMPGAMGLAAAERAVYEYLGLAWYYFKGAVGF